MSQTHDKDTTDRITLYLPKDEVALIRAEAVRQRLTLTQVVERQLVPFLAHLKQQDLMRQAAEGN